MPFRRNNKDTLDSSLLTDLRTAKMIIHSSMDAIICVDASSIIRMWNPSAEKLFGWKEEEVLGCSLHSTIIPKRYWKLHDQSMLNFFDLRQSVMLNRLLEISAVNKAGEEFHVELTIIPLRRDGEDLFCGFVRNISSRKQAEERVLRHKKVSDSIINSLPGIFYIVDQRGMFLRWNYNFELISGYNEVEIGRMNALDFFSGEQKTYIAGRISKVFEDGYSEAEADFITKQGAAIPFFFTGKLIVYEGEKCFLGMGIDISSRKMMELELIEAHNQLRQLSAYLQNIREEERATVASEIHDEMGQQLSALKMSLSWLNEMESLRNDPLQPRVKGSMELVEGIIKSVQGISEKLRPSILNDLGLAEALASHSKEFEQRFGIAVHLEIPAELITIPSSVALGLFRIYQEALINIARHAHAAHVWVRLRNKNHRLELSVEDDGDGFDTVDPKGKKTFGLLAMQERALMIDGIYSLESKKGGGTIISVSIPFEVK